MSQQHRLKVKAGRRSSGRSTPNLLNSQTTEYQSIKFKKRKREEDDEEQFSNKKSCPNPNSQKLEVSNSSNVSNTNNNRAQNRLSTLRQKIKGDLEQNKVSYNSNRTFCRKNSETKYLSQSSIKNRIGERNIVSASEDKLNTKSVNQSAVNNRLKILNSSNCPRVPEVNIVSDLRHKLKGDTLSSVNRGTNANQSQKAESSSHSSVNNRLKCIKTKSTNSTREPNENILISVKESNRQISLIEFPTSNNNDNIKLGNEILKEQTEFYDITCEDDSKSTPVEEICLPNEKTSVTEWLNGNKCEKDLDVTVNDSLLVNFDDTIVNKGEQTCNTIADNSMEWDSATEESPEKTKKENAICIVTDTNIFMHFLHKIKDIVNFKVTGSQNVKVFIPWMVITELDYIKDTSREGKNAALNAAKYINRLLEEKNPKVLGQPVEEAVKQEDYGLSPDDKILSSCVQASKKYESVILLTNDVNLRNKALLSELETSSPREILQKLLFKLKKNVKSLKISQKMASLCSTIICERCKETYGNAWDKMDMLQGSPWNFRECLRRIIRYWKSVFKDLMLKQCLPTVESLYRLLDRNKDHISDDSDTFNEFMKLVLAVLVFLKDMENKTLVQSTIEEVTAIADN